MIKHLSRSLLIFSLLLAQILLPASGWALAPLPPLAEETAAWRQALTQPHAPGEILISYRADSLSAQRAFSPPALLAQAEALTPAPALNLQHYRLSDGNPATLAALLARLNADPAVEFAEPNYYIFPDFVPNDPHYISYAANDAVTYGGYLNRLNMADAWDISRGHPGIIVAIIDSGLSLDHPDLAAAIWQNPGEIAGNGLDDDNNGLIDDINGWNFAGNSANINDWHGHGSHVGGIVGARINNGIGIAGVAPKTTLMPLGVFAQTAAGALGTFADEVKAILYAVDHGARVINLSLGSNAYSRGEQRAIEYAVARGTVVIVAAGNSGREAYHWPAAHEAAIAVASTSRDDTRSSFSNFGDYVDIAAPGERIMSLNYSGGYVTKNGTSMATPHVSGVAALILARNAMLTPAEVRTILESTATDLGSAGWDKYYGHGRVDALAALQATPPYTGTFPAPEPDWPVTAIWPDFCEELVQEGGFETDVATHWTLAGSTVITDILAATGDFSARLVAESGQQGGLGQWLLFPPDMHAATLAFNLRAESSDSNWGGDPTEPGQDHLRARFRSLTGTPILELLSASNIGASPFWDEYLHVLTPDELALLRAEGGVELYFQAENDPSASATRFYVDNVRLCAGHAPIFMPLVFQ